MKISAIQHKCDNWHPIFTAIVRGCDFPLEANQRQFIERLNHHYAESPQMRGILFEDFDEGMLFFMKFQGQST